MKAVFLDFATMGEGLDVGPLTRLVPALEVYAGTSDDEVADRIRDVEFVFANKVCLHDKLLDAAPKLRFIGLTATGTDNIDLDSAARHGVAVCNIRNYCTRSVAEHVLGLLLMMARNLHRFNIDVRAGRWQEAPDFCMLTHPIRELSTMTLGIVGLGDLGGAVADTARAFGMNVIVSARPGAAEVPEGRVPFEQLLKEADAISLHCPLTGDTKGLFGAAQFAAMKPGAFFINTSRGGLVDSAALASALAAGDIAAAAIDVLPEEPPVNGNPLLDYDGDNLLMTPHIAWASDRARQNSIVELAKNVAAFLNSEKRNRVV